MNQGQLIVKPTCAQLKYDTEWFGRMDPYVIVTLGTQTYKTHAAKDASKTPTWTDCFTFKLQQQSDQLYLKLYDKDIGSRDDFIAEGYVSIQPVIQQRSTQEWYNLTRKGKYAGKIMLIMEYMPTNNMGMGMGNMPYMPYPTGPYPPQGQMPNYGYPPQGYPNQGYPPQGFPNQGYPPQGYPPQGYPPQGYPNQGYPPQGYPNQGYPPQGYPPQGYPNQGYPPRY